MAKNAKGLQRCYNDCSQKIQGYFDQFPLLLTNRIPYEIIIAYMFQRVEYAQRMSIYCSVIKTFKTNTEMTDRAVFSWDMKRGGYQNIIDLIFNKPFPNKAMKYFQDASENRDRAMHGKVISEQDKRTAIVNIFEYAKESNAFFQTTIGIEPFGKLQGFAGRGGGGERISSQATRFVLKGLGLSVQ